MANGRTTGAGNENYGMKNSNQFLAVFAPSVDCREEISGNGYSRQPVEFEATPDGTQKNSNALSFKCIGDDWGRISHLGTFDTLTGGKLNYCIPLGIWVLVKDSYTLNFPVGSIILS